MKKLLSMILVFSLLCSLSITAFAADSTVSDGEILADAIAAAGEGGTVTVEVENADIGGAVIDKSVTIDLGNKTAVIEDPTVGSTGTVTIGLQILKTAEDVTIEGDNAILIFDGDSNGDGKDGNPKLKRGIQNYGNLTLDGVAVNGSDLANYEKIDGVQTYKADYENIVISNCNGSLTITNGAAVQADEGDVAIDVYAYTNGNYTDGPQVVITETAGGVTGTIVFDGDEGCVDKVEEEPSLSIEGGTFNNFLLKIGEAVRDFVDNISISGGNFDSKNVEGTREDDTAYVFEDFLATGYVVVEQDGCFVVMTQEAADELNKEPVAVITPAKPAPTTNYVAPAVSEDVTAEVEVDGETLSVELSARIVGGRPVDTVSLAQDASAELKVVFDKNNIHANTEKATKIIESFVNEIVVKTAGGVELDAEQYEISYDGYGTVKLELSPELLEKLGVGTHEITVVFGGFEIVFTVVIV